ncbi:hypothetical protein BsIDN1_15570 [Bacillus safensis]|uniref:RNA polymerase sigma-70 region 4 domain-containing protein n=1 Tax=Bacillus safensis TaxID=561879 RepID=A0A5S9M7M2_BACIA|nr:hypothetical protein BsIDN1_15570 [Bacillus safensis]
MSKEQQTIIEDVYFKGMTQKSIADKLGIPIGTVKGRVRLSLKHLRSKLSRGGKEEEADSVCKHQVIDYFNGHLQGEKKTQFEEHIKHCSACKEELEELTSLMSDIPFLAGDQTPPAGMKDRILSQVFEEETVEEKNSHKKKSSRLHLSQTKSNRCKKKRNQWLLPLVAALLLISAAGNVYFLSNGKEQAEEPVRVVATKSLASAASPKKRQVLFQ